MSTITTINSGDQITNSRADINTNFSNLNTDKLEAATTATLTNKTYDTAGTGNSFSINGVAVTANTGTGAVVRETSPTLVTPTLGVALATSINGATITSGTLNGSVTGTNTGDQTSIVGITGTKAQFDTAVSDGNIMFDGDSITNATSTAHRVFYGDASGVITELALGADGTFLKSNGATSAPTFATPAGSGDVSKVGTPVNNQVGVWTGDGTIEGDAALTFDTTTDVLSSGGLLLSGLTASEMVISDGSKNLVSAAVATYPSLTELTYVKGVTSAIQTQMNLKAPIASPTFTTSITTPSVLASSNDSGAIGASGTAFSDLFLASGAVINFNAGDVTLTHASNLLTYAGGQFTFGANTAYFTETDNGNSGASDTIDWTLSNKQKSTLTDNCTFTFTAPGGPCSLVLKLVQDGTGSRTVTWPAAVHWSGGTAPTLTTTASKVDIITFYYDGSTFFGSSVLNFTA